MESTKIQLFDNNEDPNDEFELKLDILSDHKTSKLIELKSKFAHDSRFNIDERFLDNDHDDESQLKAVNSGCECEKFKNIEILEQILGKKVESQSKSICSSSNKSILVPRFDPSKKECQVYEVACSTDSQHKRLPSIDFEVDYTDLTKFKKVRFDLAKKTILKSNESKHQTENFYEVSKDLKQSLSQTEDFSLSSILKCDDQNQLKNEINIRNEQLTFAPIQAQRFATENPFKYDSSESEEENVIMDEDDNKIKKENSLLIHSNEVSTKKRKFSPFVKFFFRHNDQRFDEDLFYTLDSVKSTIESGHERSMSIMRALSLRKRSAVKNAKSEKKLVTKRKILIQLAQSRKRNTWKRRQFSCQTARNAFVEKT